MKAVAASNNSELANAPLQRQISGRVLVLLLFGSLIATCFVAAVAWPEWLDGEELLPIAEASLVAIWYGLLLAALLFVMRRAGIGVRPLVARSLDQPRWMWSMSMTVGLLALSIGALYATYVPLSYLSPSFVTSWVLEDAAPLIWSTDEPGVAMASAMNVFVIVILAPVVEELLFRGLLFPSWASRWGYRRAAVVSSVLFGLMHVEVVGAIVFGYVLALIFAKTRSLRVPILIHMANNLLSVIPDLWFAGDSAEEYSLAEFRSEWWIAVVGLGVGCPLLWVLVRRAKLALPSRPADPA